MPEPSDPAANDDPATLRPAPPELLLDAIDALPPADRRSVLRWLLEQRQRPDHPPWTQPPMPPPQLSRLIPQLVPQQALTSWFTSLRGEHQVVPVRLETDRYEQLRDWCQQHGFSMATVIRGLTAKFLDEQRPPTPPAAPAGR